MNFSLEAARHAEREAGSAPKALPALATINGSEASSVPSAKPLTLAGNWSFSLDPSDIGLQQQWQNKDLAEKIQLPGTLQNQGFGDDVSVDTKWVGIIQSRAWFDDPKYAPYRQPGNVLIPFWLQPRKHFLGAAWYQREIDIPDAWADKHLELVLERPHWGTTAWLDGFPLGARDSLATPHRYELPASTAIGRHRLALRIDNRILIPVGNDAHSVSEHAQGSWNGVIGEIQLRATRMGWLENLQIYPHVASRSVTVTGTLITRSQRNQPAAILLAISCATSAAPDESPDHTTLLTSQSLQVNGSETGQSFTTKLFLGPEAGLWDEFSPALYSLTATVDGEDPETITFGLREFCATGHGFAVNGRPTMLRGTIECAIFPKTGTPPTEVEPWRRIYRICRAHGLNHMRFHSWCPPRAAFDAADLEGFYLQVECGVWGLPGDIPMLDDFIFAEGDRILREYGNHPSFMMLCHGNEPHSENKRGFLAKLVERWKASDSRRLYTSGAHHPLIPENDFDVAGYVEGFHLRYHGVLHPEPPSTLRNYSDQLASHASPVVAHEPGQWCAFPNLGEIAKYDGFMRSGALEITRDFMVRNGLIDRAQVFLMASGRFQTLLYKEEIEALLRTPGLGGFQLLSLTDFPGQGTATVGVLDSFWEPKGYVTAEEFRKFCGPTVLLATFPRRIWLQDEEFTAEISIAHFGARPISRARPVWRLTDALGHGVARGELVIQDIPVGRNTNLGQITLPLSNFSRAQKLVLQLELSPSSCRNSWEFWVYPLNNAQTTPANIHVVHAFDQKTSALLTAGERVVLLLKPAAIDGDTEGSFAPIFWNRSWFPAQKEHTLGLVCDVRHPALENFPTEFHSNWQWYDLQNRSKPMILNNLPADLRPFVEPIDDWNQCRRLALIFEARVGLGRLLVCSIDLTSELATRPVARQMRRSLLDYAASPQFEPSTLLAADKLQELLLPVTPAAALSRAASGSAARQ